MKKYVNLSIFYLVLGLVFGVFFREFTKLNGFIGITTLSALHGHALILGFIFFLIVLILDKLFEISKAKAYKGWLIAYNVSLVFMLITLLVRGILQVNGSDFAGLSHIAGLAHTMLGLSFIWFATILYKKVK
ncbi:DUF2871 domain-containing protein [Clostridium sp. NSJ-49]|jgi:hypothetical protein|uniref:Protein of uncharacterized function (DUF2871) n=1 Tax=Clostridium disporicum TaxID=84024 RepID=A0A174KY22_9CLOT|nr:MULTISPECIES: DUF2871 domain-containing protein [Clostridium]MBC5627086.1 DUF2871 domain-containing protein [Clostridium sp. NSJ-49]MCD2500306.1 DUF2871 domain-containing protein [Clostridium sp. NSJ-145]MDU6341036.1 DUF2871 domain-containing protein [Clostridium sp.]CUP14718.1 Protein of uncharacterised function (DUF2871) [Clostridium disporicum]